MAESEQKKLIKFGNSSYIITLPKRWIDKHKLKKGDNVYVTIDSQDQIIIANKDKTNKIVSEPFVINTDNKNFKEIRRELTSAYVNNSEEIIFMGKDILSRKDDVLKILGEKTGIEITDESKDKIVVKDIFDFDSVSLERITRRMDNILRSMFEELLIGLKSSPVKEWTIKEIYKGDDGANKMYFLMLKLIRKYQEDAGMMYRSNLNNRKLSDASWFAVHSESLGDEIKRTAKFIKQGEFDEEDVKNLHKTISKIEKDYIESISAYYKTDKKLAQQTANSKDENLKAVEHFFSSSSNVLKGNVAEKIKGMIIAIHNIAKITAY